MKAGWRVTRVGEICTFNYGKALPESARKGGSTPVFGSNGVVGFHNSSITSGKTIVIGRKGSFGEVHYSEVPSWPIDTAYFVDETSTEQDMRWLFYRLGCLGLNQMNKAAAVPGLNREDAYRQELLLPPLSEQRRIAAILDKADALRTKRREALAQLDRLASSIFLEMFGDPAVNQKGWPERPMAELFVSPPVFGTMIPPRPDGGEWLSLRVANIQDWRLDLTDQKFVNLPANTIERHGVQDGDLLLARAIASQEHLGKAVVAKPSGRKWAFDSHLMRLRFNQTRALPEFIRHLWMTPGGRSLFLKATRRSAVQFNINTTEMNTLVLPVPPLNRQREFVDRIEAQSSLRQKQELALEANALLICSLQQRAFLGEL